MSRHDSDMDHAEWLNPSPLPCVDCDEPASVQTDRDGKWYCRTCLEARFPSPQYFPPMRHRDPGDEDDAPQTPEPDRMDYIWSRRPDWWTEVI